MVAKPRADGYPHPKALINLSNEDAFQSWLVDVFERLGYDVWTEVESADRSCRVDLIVDSDKWGTHGVELKFGEKNRPRDWSSAMVQASRYATHQYEGFEIDNWAIGVAEQLHEEDGQYTMWDSRRKRGFLEFLSNIGFGVLSFTGRVELIYNWSNPMAKIPVGNVEYETGDVVAPDLDRLAKADTREVHKYLQKTEPQVIANE